MIKNLKKILLKKLLDPKKKNIFFYGASKTPPDGWGIFSGNRLKSKLEKLKKKTLIIKNKSRTKAKLHTGQEKNKMKNIIQKLNIKNTNIKNAFIVLILLFSIFSFLFNSKIVRAVGEPTVDLTYSSNPAKVGTNTITATYSEPITTIPNISINQPGSTDISNTAMTSAGASTWTARSAASASYWTSVTYGNGLFVAVSNTNAIMTSPDGITWTPRTAAGSRWWRSVTYGNGLFVVVGDEGVESMVMTSIDGTTWTARTPSEPNWWQSVTYGNGLFVAVAGDGTNRVMTSPDGITWTARSAASASFWQSVTYGNGLFVAVANSTNKMMRSIDGITWTPSYMSSSGGWLSVTYGNGLFVAVKYDGTAGRIATSPDGITWTARTYPEANSWQSVTYGNGLFVAVARDGTNRVMTSPDGITWTAKSAAEANSWKSVIYGNGLFVAVSTDGTNRVMTSSSGDVYTYAYTVNSANGGTYVDGTATVSLSATVDGDGNSSGAPTNNTFVIDTTNPTVALTYSSNPVKAGTEIITATYSEAITSTPNISINQPGSTDISDVAMTSAGGNIYTYTYTVNTANGSTYIDGTATVSLSTTTDLAGNSSSIPTGATFTIDTTGPAVALSYSRNPTGAGTNTVTALYSEGVASTPTISINQPGSTDISNVAMTAPATTWTVGTPTEANSWYSVTYGNGLFVAVSTGGTNRVMTSPDGINWTPRSASEANSWQSVTYGNGLFVAVSSTGTNRVMTSLNGIAWTPRSASEARTWKSVTYGNGLFVAVSNEYNDGRIMTSPDGITWTPSTSPSAKGWVSVTYGNGLFVAVSPNSTNAIMTSPDGITWTPIATPVGRYAHSITYGNGTFVTVASGDYVMTSPDGITWTPRSFGASDQWQSVTFGNGLFVAVSTGATNRVMTSPDGITWTTKSAAEANSWRSVTYGNGLFVAVSSTGTNRAMTSSAGYTYDYIVNTANGSTYVDGTATVSLSSVTDLAGNTAGAPTGNTFTIDTTGATVNLTYSKNPAGVGVNTITATYSKEITSAPNISINQPGSTDIADQPMSGSGAIWTYDYTVNGANGSTYIDGTATVSLSATLDTMGNTSSAPTNSSFEIDTVGPTADITYSINHAVKSGDSLIITATFNKAVADSPIPKIEITGENTLSATDMIKTDATHYYYTHTVGAGNGVATIALSTGTDLGGNPVVATPTSGATFTIDNIQPNASITAICSTEGNDCTTLGENANPQEAYIVNSILGTASDDVGGSGLDAVFISIKDTNTNKWYNETSFTDDTETYLTTTGTDTWAYVTTTVPLVMGNIYLINIKPTDIAGNNQVVSLSFKFTNSSPTVSNVTASQDVTGLVSVSYDVTDVESTQTTNYLFYKIIGVTLNGEIDNDATSLLVSDGTNFPTTGSILIDDEIISYTSKVGNTLEGLTRGAQNTSAVLHNTGVDLYVKANSATGAGIGLSNIGIGKSISWLARTDADGYESATEIIKVVANDGATASMVGSASSSEFSLDAKKPTAIVTFDAGVAGEEDSATITIPKPADISAVEYKISDDASTETNPVDTGWVSLPSSTTIPWSFDADIEVKTLKYQFRDSFGNTSAETTITTQTPVPSGSFIVQDTSNVTSEPPNYDMYIGWQAASATDFSSYKLEYATSDDNTNYTAYGTISDSSFSTAGSNYYVYRNLNPDKFYRFRLGVIGTNGNTSVRSNSFITAKPDGVQNYGEGGGGSIASASKVENVIPEQALNKNVTITYKLTDVSILKKVNPLYEGYVFYNIGITLPEDSYTNNTLTLTDASKLNSSGYILVNNEVIGYSGKDVNTLTGLTRGTWPNLYSAGRSTRTNPSFLEGTPVWVMANDTTPININDVSIETGQDGSIVWDTSNETNLLGDTYSDVGIKVIVHDNQDPLSGPLSSQNDFSENGILSVLDLSDAGTGSDAIKSTSAVISWTTTDYADSVVEYSTVAPGNEGEYNLNKSNSDMVLNHRIYLNNLTPATLYYLRTKSTNLNGETVISTSELTTTAGPVLSAVSSGNISDVSSTISWTTDLPATSYVIYSINSDLSSSTRVGSDELVTEHSVILNGLVPLTNYYYKVESADAVSLGNTGEETNDENYYTFATLSDMSPPIISNISVPIISSSSIAIVWNTNEPADSQVMYGTETESYTEETNVSESLVLNHLITVDELSANTNYYYVIKSADENGNITTSEEQIVTTAEIEQVIISGGGGSSGVLQSIYDALVAENEANKAKLKNQNSEIPIISNVKVSNVTAFGATVNFNTNVDTMAFVKYGKDKDYSLVIADDIFSKTHAVKLYGLNMGTDYYFKVKVIDRYSNEATSEEQAFKTKFFSENLSELTKIENIEQFQAEIESTIESILPSLVPPFIGEPVISDITENSATITFKTNIKAYPIVSYATDSYYDVAKDNPYDGEISDTTAKNISHTLQIIGLKPNTKYHVMAKAFSLPQVVGKGEDLTFSTKASRIKASIVERKNDSFTIVWTTDEPTSSIVEYKNIKNGKAGRMTDEAKNTSHSVKVENLTPGSSYQVNVSGINSIGNLVEGAEAITVNTSTDVIPPTITNFKVDSALVLGRTDKTQTIVSWQTDEPATSVVYYEEGSGSPDKELVNRKEDTELTMNHTAILTTLKPGTVYRFQIASVDNANNMNKLPIRTIITPRPNESIVDIIFKNFDETFNFIKNVK